MLRFRLAGVPYTILPIFWITNAVFGSRVAQGPNALLLLAIWVLCVFVSIVLHELGHALAARRVGVSPYVVLYGMGGATFLPGGGLSRPQSIFVSLAGPAAGFCVYLGIYTLRYALETTSLGGGLYSGNLTSLAVQEAVDDLAYINGFWTLVNLLPILPLDGGQVLRDILGPSLRVVTRSVGGLCAAACGVWAFLHGLPILAFFLGYLAFVNFRGDARTLPGGVEAGGQGGVGP